MREILATECEEVGSTTICTYVYDESGYTSGLIANGIFIFLAILAIIMFVFKK